MKKPVTLIIVYAMALSLVACGSNKEEEKPATRKDVQMEAQDAKKEDTAKGAEGETATKDEELTAKEPSDGFVEPAAEEFEYHYLAKYEGILITAYNGEARAIRVPAELDGEPVKQVSFYNNKSITHIELPDSVTEMDYGAFRDCSSLTEITIPDSVTMIKSEAFLNCSSLTEITIPDSVTGIGMQAFEGCSSLTEITVPDSVTVIGARAFFGCSSLTEITIPDSVTRIGEEAFSGCSSLTEIIIPDSVEDFGAGGIFSGCDGLKVTYQGQEYTYPSDSYYWLH